MSVPILCPWCGDEVNTKKNGVMRFVTGWEETRSQGGANKIAFRTETGQWAHKGCVESHGGDITNQHEASSLF